jgi:asparagine synthase (glutamine-hydrolysing)
LPGGHLLALEGEPAARPYWAPRLGGGPSAPDEAVEAMQESLVVAVRSAVAGDRPVGAHLSGGLDSSAIAALASRELQDRGRSIVGGWSWSPAPVVAVDELPPADERRVVAAVAERWGFPVHWVDLTPEDIARSMRRGLDPAEHAQLLHHPPTLESAAQAGVRVLLSGWGGDELASSVGRGALEGLLRRGRLVTAVRLADRPAQPGGPRRRAAAVRRCLAVARRMTKGPQPDALMTRFRPALEAKGVGAERIHARAGEVVAARAVPRLPAGAAHMMRWLVDRGHLESRAASWHHAGEAHGIEHRYPLLDRRVVELALSLPDEVHLHGPSRWVFRAATEDVLGPALAWSTAVKQEPAKWDLQWPVMASVDPVRPDGDPVAAEIFFRWFATRQEINRLIRDGH